MFTQTLEESAGRKEIYRVIFIKGKEAKTNLKIVCYYEGNLVGVEQVYSDLVLAGDGGRLRVIGRGIEFLPAIR